ncbi:hypothetical protein N7463_005459 [Penicillium fimorum]|uniref:Uncharacterized protein n=1 Tax=Penicillium fimorum TaxID=1882269 RepID=A0A9W9XSJ8_9EURO|nr:hypothetical protein N7463_005459 [Penicillium fimorum]
MTIVVACSSQPSPARFRPKIGCVAIRSWTGKVFKSWRLTPVVLAIEVDASGTTYNILHDQYLILHIIPAGAIIARRAWMVTRGLEPAAPTENNSSWCLL